MITYNNGIKVRQLEVQQFDSNIDVFAFEFARITNGFDLNDLTPRIVFDGVLTAILGVDPRITKEVTASTITIKFKVPDLVTQTEGYGRGQISFYDSTKAKYSQVFAYIVRPSVAIAGWTPDRKNYWDEYMSTITETGEQVAEDKETVLDAKDVVLEAKEDVEEESEKALADIALAKSGALTDISNAKSGAVTEVNTTKTNAVSAVNNAKTQAIEAVNSAKDSGVSAVNSAKETSLAQISTKTDEQLARIPEVTQLASQVSVLNADTSLLKKNQKADERSLEMLWKVNKGITYTTEEDTTSAYSKSIPSGAVGMVLDNIGGHTVKFRQILKAMRSDLVFGSSRDSMTIADNEVVFDWISKGLHYICYNSPMKLETGNKYYLSAFVKATQNASAMFGNYVHLLTIGSVTSNYSKLDCVYDCDRTDNPLFGINETNFTTGDKAYIKNPMAINLTEMFGSGNEPTIEICRQLFTQDYYEYSNANVLKSAIVDKVEVGTSATTYTPYKAKAQYSIPSAVLNLPNYGVGISDSVRNYVDFENKTYVQMCGKYTFTGNESWARDSGGYWYLYRSDISTAVNSNNAPFVAEYNATCFYAIPNYVRIWSDDSTNKPSGVFYVGLATPIVTDITDLLADFENDMLCEGNGTITFKQTDSTINIPVPNKEEYIVKVSEAV